VVSDIAPADLSTGYLVEQVHENESVEHDGEMHSHILTLSVVRVNFVRIKVGVHKVITYSEPPGDGVEHDNHNKELVDNLDGDVSPHEG
jgi:hypothetical protein